MHCVSDIVAFKAGNRLLSADYHSYEDVNKKVQKIENFLTYYIQRSSFLVSETRLKYDALVINCSNLCTSTP